jgi:hypothetical protein
MHNISFILVCVIILYMLFSPSQVALPPDDGLDRAKTSSCVLSQIINQMFLVLLDILLLFKCKKHNRMSNIKTC